MEPITQASPHRLRGVMFSQLWRQLLFLHWPVDPDLVAPLLPRGTRPDCLDGVTYVGLVPFRMSSVSVLGSPAVPYLGDFLETNVRLYSVDDQGRRGVVFRSLDTARLLPVTMARYGLGIPYTWSAMSLRRNGDELDYRCSRRWPGPRGARGHIVARLGDHVTTNRLDDFLTNRWALHTRVAGATWFIPNAHPRWSFRQAELLDLDEDLITAAGLPRPSGPPVSALFSEGVPVHFGLPVPLRSTQSSDR